MTSELAQQEDGFLAARVVDGDREAATVLILRYQQCVRSFLYRICGDAVLADDLAQETFVRLLKYAGNYDPNQPMRRWLLTIARRLLINYRSRKDQQVISTDYQGMPKRTGEAEVGTDLMQEEKQRCLKDLLEQAMNQLNETQREIMLLFHREELSVKDISAIVEMPEGTVKSHLHRARSAMRKSLTSLLTPQQQETLFSA